MNDRHAMQAAVGYGVLGAAILGIILATPELARPERRADVVHLLVGLPFFLLFALAIAYGHRAVAAILRLGGVSAPRAGRIGERLRHALVVLLSVSALGRTIVFAGNGLGRRPRIGLEPPYLSFETTSAEPPMLLNALLMAVILVLLVRASWLPILRSGRRSR